MLTDTWHVPVSHAVVDVASVFSVVRANVCFRPGLCRQRIITRADKLCPVVLPVVRARLIHCFGLLQVVDIRFEGTSVYFCEPFGLSYCPYVSLEIFRFCHVSCVVS